ALLRRYFQLLLHADCTLSALKLHPFCSLSAPQSDDLRSTYVAADAELTQLPKFR
ncbi:hypothetical protein ALP68_02784, partial [Pseudomonas ficuserectae]